MSETTMNVKLLAHTQLSDEFIEDMMTDELYDDWIVGQIKGGQAIALTAIRTCYSPLKPSEIVAKEGEKYFGNKATDGEGGTEADRLFRHITRSGHLSTLEHLSYTFAIEGVSRTLLAQLTRHRVGFSYSVQSQRYVKLGSSDKSEGFDFVVPEGLENRPISDAVFRQAMEHVQRAYDTMREAGVTAEDARSVLPQSSACNLTMTANLRSLLDFCGKRQKRNGAQGEISELSERLKAAVVAVDPWTEAYFEEARYPLA